MKRHHPPTWTGASSASHISTHLAHGAGVRASGANLWGPLASWAQPSINESLVSYHYKGGDFHCSIHLCRSDIRLEPFLVRKILGEKTCPFKAVAKFLSSSMKSTLLWDCCRTTVSVKEFLRFIIIFFSIPKCCLTSTVFSSLQSISLTYDDISDRRLCNPALSRLSGMK